MKTVIVFPEEFEWEYHCTYTRLAQTLHALGDQGPARDGRLVLLRDRVLRLKSDKE